VVNKYIKINLEGINVVITGGAGGIGNAIAQAYLMCGANVIVLDKLPKGKYLEKIANEKFKNKISYYEVDLLNEEETNTVLESVINKFKTITHLINNVGIYGNDGIHEINILEFKNMLDINLMISLRMLKFFIPKMKEQKFGRIINIASVAAFLNGVNSGTYNMSKVAVVSMTKTLAKEVRSNNIRVNAICPGLVNTPMLDNMISRRSNYCNQSYEDYYKNLMNVCEQERLVEPEEVANVAAFLGSELSSGISGVSILVTTGGLIY